MKQTLLVIDAHAMAYRAYYALQNQRLTNSKGQSTAAIFGFFRMLFKVLKDYNPELTAVTWDPPGGSFRNQTYKEYKATRKPMPDDLRFQIDEIKTLLEKSGFPVILEKGFEADDVMGTLAARFGKKHKVLLLTGDKDCFQLLGKNVGMLRASKGVSEFIEIDPDWVEKELGVKTTQIIDYMALVGDSSDNIPGAKGVGPKTAEKLIQDYKTIDGIYKKIDEIKPAGTQKKLSENKDEVYLSRDLVTIRTDVKAILEMKEETLITPQYRTAETAKLFLNEGYTQIHQDLLRQSGDSKQGKGKSAKNEDPDSRDVKRDYKLVDDAKSLAAMKKALSKAKLLAVDTETNSVEPVRADLVGISISDKPGRAWYIAIGSGGDLFTEKKLSLDEILPDLKEILENESCQYTGQNIKYDYIILKRHGIELANISFDTMIGSYLLDPGLRRHNLDDLAFDRLGVETIKYSDIAGTGKKAKTFDEIDPAEICDYACEDADLTLQLHNQISQEVKKEKLTGVLEKIELPLIPVLARMEMEGVSIDQKYFAKLSKEYDTKLSSVEKKIHKEAGEEFNINSTKELQRILFDQLGLPKGKKTKTGYSTDQSVLEDLKDHHKIVQYLLDHRKYSKLKGTYIDALPALVHESSGKIHASFNQTIAATGRLSCTDPNLQNIPIRDESGRAIRRGFVASGKDNVLLSLDYSQIELRIMAHFAKDEALLRAFSEELDIHAMTAASVFHVDESEVTADMRSRAKTVNFSIIYGVTEFGLGQNLSISREEARSYIDRFFDAYPGVKKYMDETVKFAEKKGYVETIFGRRRYIPDITSSNRFRKEGAIRTAVNTPVQGTSADIIKLAMIEIDQKFRAKKLQSKMILQVHDELVFDVYRPELDEVKKLAGDIMQNCVKLDVPLKVEGSAGNNWDEAH